MCFRYQLTSLLQLKWSYEKPTYNIILRSQIDEYRVSVTKQIQPCSQTIPSQVEPFDRRHAWLTKCHFTVAKSRHRPKHYGLWALLSQQCAHVIAFRNPHVAIAGNLVFVYGCLIDTRYVAAVPLP